MKKILLSSITIMALGTTGLFSSSVDTKIAELEKKLNEYKKMKDMQISNLEEQIKNIKASKEEEQEEVSELSDLVESIETKTLSNKVNFGIGFKTRYDRVKYSSNQNLRNDNMWNTRVNLNMKAKINDDIKFTGRITSYRNWGTDLRLPSDYGNYEVNNGETFIERAYVDWKASNGKVPIIFTIGRQPSTDGFSSEFGQNSVRKGTYDPLLFDKSTDAIVMTLPLNKVTNNDSLALRFAYGVPYQRAGFKKDNSFDVNELYGLFLEGNIPYLNRAKFYLSYVQVRDIITPIQKGQLGTHPVTKQALPALEKKLNAGDVTVQSIAVEYPNIIKGLDVFAHYGMSKTKPSSDTFGTVAGLPISNVPILLDGSGHAIWVGARYSTNYGKFGLEYNKGSKNWINFTRETYSSAFNKLSTRGDVWDIYYIKDLTKATHFKLGYARYKYDYAGSGYFNNSNPKANGPLKSDDTIKNIYAEFVVNF